MIILVLSRFKDEALTIGDDITVVVVDVCGNKVRLGVDAPRQVPVHRVEVYDKIKRRDGVVNADDSHERKEATRQLLKAELTNALIVLQSPGICSGDILVALRDRIKSVLED